MLKSEISSKWNPYILKKYDRNFKSECAALVYTPININCFARPAKNNTNNNIKLTHGTQKLTILNQTNNKFSKFFFLMRVFYGIKNMYLKYFIFIFFLKIP